MDRPSTGKLFNVLLPSGEEMLSCQGLAFGGKLWLVPQWLEQPATARRKPERMIRFDNLAHQPMPDGYLVNAPIPIAVLQGERRDGYETLEGSEVPFSLSRVQ